MDHLDRRDLLRACGLVVTGGTTGCGALPFGGGAAGQSAQWPVTGASGRRDFHNPGARIPASAPSADWRTSRLSGRFGLAVLATADRAVAATEAGVRAVDLADGSTAWSYRYPVSGGGTDLAIADGRLVVRQFFPDANRRTSVTGLDLADGDADYETTHGSDRSALLLPTADGLLGLRSGTTLARLDPATGEWGEPIHEAEGEIWGTVADDERVYLPVGDGQGATVDAVDPADGGPVWTYDVQGEGPVSVRAIGDRVVVTDAPDVAGTYGARGLAANTGEEAWQYSWDARDVVPWHSLGTPETVFLFARPGETAPFRVAALDVADGGRRWVGDTTVQFPFAVTADRVVGTRATDRPPAPAMSAIDASSGEPVWTVEPGRGVEPGIAVDAGMLAFVAGDDGLSLALFS